MAAVLTGAVFVATVTSATTALTASDPVVTTKVLTIILENHSLPQSRNAMPYLDSLVTGYGQATGFQSLTHPSLGNYLGAVSGQGVATCGMSNPLPAACPQSGLTVLDQAIAAGHTARLYAEDMPAPCAPADAGGYVVHHNPWAYFLDPGPHSNCLAGDVPMGTPAAGALIDDVTAGTLPDVGWLVPNNTDNAHDAPLAAANAWLQAWLPRIIAGPDYTAGRLAIGITWDEPDPAVPVTTPVGLVVVSPNAARQDSAAPFTLYSWLRYQEDVLGVPYLGAAATAPDLRAWVPIRTGTPPATRDPTPTTPGPTPPAPSSSPIVTTPTTPASTGTPTTSALAPIATSASPAAAPAAPRSCPPGKPAVVSSSITILGPASAKVTAQINPNGSDTKANAEWGPTRSLGRGSAKTALGSGCAPVTLTATLTGLTAGQAFYWRVIAESKAGNVYPAPFLAGPVAAPVAAALR